VRSDEDRILDISEAIAAISKRVRSRKDFDDDELLRVWCLHHIVVIGEAASRVSEALKERYPEVPWRRVVAMRNAVVHGYFQVDWDQVWAVVERDLDPLRVAVDGILAAEGWGG
jgi:uncharacterized protein with HEPN domain